MANEFMLSTNARKNKSVYEKRDGRGDLVHTRTIWSDYPVGQVLSVKTDTDRRREWLQIICNMCAPAFTYSHPNGNNIARKNKRREGFERWENMGWTQLGWDAIKDTWTEARFDAWFKASIKEPISRTVDEIALWTDIETSLQKDDVGRDSRNKQYLTDVFPWVPGTKKRQVIILNTDLTEATAKTYEGKKEIITDVSDTVQEVTYTPNKVIDYVTDIGLSKSDLDEINDKDAIYEPRYERKVAGSKARDATIIKW